MTDLASKLMQYLLKALHHPVFSMASGIYREISVEADYLEI